MKEIIQAFDDNYKLKSVKELVRCKDCKYWLNIQNDILKCTICNYDAMTGRIGILMIMGPYDYCSRAERKSKK